jgi:hypothetical protein
LGLQFRNYPASPFTFSPPLIETGSIKAVPEVSPMVARVAVAMRLGGLLLYRKITDARPTNLSPRFRARRSHHCRLKAP